MSDGARAQFTWPHPGQTRVADPQAFSQPAPERSDPALPTFALVVLDVQEVDHLQLKENQRTIYRRQPPPPGRQAAEQADGGDAAGGEGASGPSSEWSLGEDVNP